MPQRQFTTSEHDFCKNNFNFDVSTCQLSSSGISQCILLVKMANFEDGGYATKPYNVWQSMWKRGAYDWEDGSLDWKTNIDFDKWHFPYCCGICKRGEMCGVALSKCSGCKMTYYCSKEHQKRAWKVHKHACKHFAAFFANHQSDRSGNIASRKRNLIIDITELRLHASASGGKDPIEDQMNADEWFNQRHCVVCNMNPAAAGADTSSSTRKTQLVECQRCHCVAHCSTPACEERFRSVHNEEQCELHFIGFAALVMAMQQGNSLCVSSNKREVAVPTTTTSSSSSSASRLLPRNWGEFFQRRINDFDVPAALLEMPPVMVSKWFHYRSK